MYITNFLTLQNQLKIHHWQTTSYSEHVSLGKAYEDLEELIDNFVETSMGKYGKRLSSCGFKVELENYKDLNITDFLKQYDKYLSTELDAELKEGDTELRNIRDDMKNVINHTLYMLQLK